ncbi:hypothetical protein K3495_g3496 [Podosphaera aphanis]|nr:hypothetical protein K3495_g3496 [Podosphaera aphanis]
MRSRTENSILSRKRIECHAFKNEEGDEYEASGFGGFSEYFQRKRLKLQNRDAELRSNSLNKPQIFRGIIIHVNGYTQPSLNDLHDLIVSHGGGFLQYLDGKSLVTHIIAASLTPRKAIEFRKYRIVKPAWIVDSVAAGTIIPWNRYKVIDEGPGQQLLGIENSSIIGRKNIKNKSYTDQTDTSWYNRQIKKVVDGIDNDTLSSLDISTNTHGDHVIKASNHSLCHQPLLRHQKDNLKDYLLPEDDSLSTEEFEMTSSLEDVLDNARALLNFHHGKTEISSDTHENNEERILLSPTKCLSESHGRNRPSIPSVDSSKTSLNSGSKFQLPDAENKHLKIRHEAMSAEEQNALLLADPKVRRTTSANPNFIAQYYSESRLHHLSVWKAELKSRLQKMAEEKSASQKQSVKLKQGTRRYILHVDFDCFFCAVSLKNFPNLIDKPAVVAHGNKSGSEIASCNYPARSFGVKNGMWMKSALELCPKLNVLPYDFPAYEETSNIFYQLILEIGGVVQSVSVDEALIDITSLCQGDSLDTWEESTCYQKANSIADDLRSRIKKETGCEVSVGIGNNILLAKLALRKAKPAGKYQVRPEKVLSFIGELDVRDLPGVAHSIGGKLKAIGVNLVKDIRLLSKNRLMTALGRKLGEKIWDYSHGIDHSEVGEQAVRKSVSAEVNWGIRFISQAEAEEFVQNLCIELQRRLLDQMVQGRQLAVKIMRKSPGSPHEPVKHLGHGICDKFNKSIVLGVATNDADVLGREAISILRSYNFPAGELRGLGVQMTKLEAWKPTCPSMLRGCQKRIEFGIPAFTKIDRESPEDHIDEPETSENHKTIPVNIKKYGIKTDGNFYGDSCDPPRVKTISRFLSKNDPIHDDGPAKISNSSIHPAAAITKANSTDLSATKPLNITGTQFIIPTQIDSSVLAKLPQNIQSRMMEQSRLRNVSRSEPLASRSDVSNPNKPDSEPIPSQLDPEIFAALPNDVKAEVLASYRATERPHPAQPGPHDPPRKTWTLSKQPTKKTSMVRKRTRLRTVGVGVKSKPGPRQSNLITPRGTICKDQSPEDTADDTLDPDFLAALPEDVRQEVLTEHRRQQQIAKQSLLSTALNVNKKRRLGSLPPPPPPAQCKIVLPTREPRPTFTTRDLSSVAQLRETTSAWFREFSDNGPHPEDVAALGRYLRRVVLDERDLAKVVSIVRWLGWLIDESNEDTSGMKSWITAFEQIKEIVQLAVRERGLGKLDI